VDVTVRNSIPAYVELHARSAFSFLEGASLPEDLIGAGMALGMPAMGLLDRDGVYGSPRFHLAAKKAGIKAHIGAEVTVEFPIPNCRLPIETARVAPAIGNRKLEIGNALPRLPLLVCSRTGYQNLCQLITKMKLRANKGEGAVREDELQEHASGLICLTGGNEGPLAAALARGGMQAARDMIDRLIGIFGHENVYVELQRHFHRDEEARNQAAIEIAASFHLPLLATNGVCYTTAIQRELCDIFTALRHHRTLTTAGRLLARNSERHLKSPAEMHELFADLPKALANTIELSSRLDFQLDTLGYQFPRYPVPDGETMMSFLRERTWEGFRDRYGCPTLSRSVRNSGISADLRQRAKRQIERELALIQKLDLAGYFLIVWDLVKFCREEKILVQGRGSAANSAVCYSLGITAVDPIKMELLFERFLSEERGEWPDIDLDLPSGDQRERVIQHVYKRYGERGAAMTANVITYRGRLAAREMGKALGFESETLDRLAAVVGTWEYRDEHDGLDRRFYDAGLDLRHPRLRKYFELCEAVQDLPRHLGQHSGGMVVCQGQLDSVVPLEPASMPGRVVVQWDKDDCSDLGIVKVDLLGLGMMAVLEDSIEIIRKDYGEEVDLAHLPADDPAVYSTLQNADTIGMFQIESRAQMSCLPRLRPQKFYDIVVQVAIIRPGPIVGQMVNPYLERRMGRQAVEYAHPSLEPVLARTLGVPLFQEQLLRIAMIAANFTGGEAEELRRAMGFKRSQARMKEIETKLRAGMTKNGISPEAQEQIVLSITSFALYGFPESHAASFALLAYASAYLKCRYLGAFTAALLNNQPMGFYHPATIVKDAQRHGLKILPVDVMKSDWLCTMETVPCPRSSGHSEEVPSPQSSVLGEEALDSRLPRPSEAEVLSPRRSAPSEAIRSTTIQSLQGRNRTARDVSPGGTHNTTESRRDGTLALRLGFRYVRGLHEEAGQAIVRARAAAPFSSIHDLVHRVPELHKDELQTLAEIGALNSIKNPRHEPARITDFQSTINNHQSSIPPSTIHYFHRRDALWQVERVVRYAGPMLEELPELDGKSPLESMNAEERLVADFRGTGLTVGPHPMSYRRKEMDRLGIRRAGELSQLRNGQRVRIAGCVIVRQRPGTAKGFVFLSMEDETGVANAIITPDMFQKHRLLLVSEKFVMIEGVLQNLDNVISVKADRILPLSITEAQTTSHDFH
jgi:error-prone DNA polymerase